MEKIKFYGNKKREKGAITLFVLLACLFFVFILTGVYLSLLNRAQVQEQEVQQIRDNYAKDFDRIEEIYDNLAKTTIVILRQEPANGTWTKEVTLVGNAKIDEKSTATIVGYIFNQESTKSGSTSWSWKTVSGTNIKELTEEEKVTNNGKYYFWVKDSEGEIHRSNEIEVKNIDKNNPTAGTLIAKEQNEDGTESEYDLIKSPWTDKDVKIEKVDGTDGEGKTETVYTILKNGVEYEGSVTNPKTEPTTLTETGEYTVTVITKDEAGNTAEREYTIKIDKIVPILALKHNDANGAEYEQGTWTKDNLYGEINLDTSKTGKEVEKYQYSENGVIWKDISSKIIPGSIDYTTKFPMSSDKPEWIIEPVNNGTYYFETQADGTLKPNNKGKNNTTANSYFEIDLTNQPNATVEITINATISSQIWADFGYATIKTSAGAPAYNDSNGRFIYEDGSTSTSDYSTTIKGGQKYYLHIGYRKDFLTAMYQDSFIINRITLKADTLTKELNFYNFNKNENTVTFDFKEEMEKEIYVRAVYTDGKITKYGDKTSVKIDKVVPIIESANPILISRDKAKADIKATDKGSGVRGYYISTGQTAPTENSDWIAQTMNEFTIENLNANTTYYLWTIDNVGNISERKDIVIGTANYIVDNRTTTETLEEAISVANDSSIIKLLGDYTDTSTATFNKSVTLNVQSYTLTREATITIDSGKIVEITGTGKITSRTSNISTITNNGTLTVSNSITIENNSTSVNNAPIYSNSSSAITSINDNTQIIGYYRGIYNNYGTLNLNGGKIEATNQSSSAYGIYNYSSSSKTYITNGEIKGYYGIYNGSSSTVEMTGGKVIGTGAEGIYAYGTTNVYGGKIEGKTYGICGYATNKVTIGREEDELSTTSPAIYGGNYGIYMNNSSYNFNFYNGVIISNTKETAYRGNLNPRTKHMTYTYFDYDVEQKYCTVLTPMVEKIKMEATPTEFTNGDVTVTITYPNNNEIKQYSEDGTIWKEANDYIQEVIVTENKTIYARTMNESGIITDEEQIEITNIDKEKPTVTINPTKTVYTVTEVNGKVDLNITLTAQDTGVSGLDKMQYAWVKEGEQVTTYTDFSNTTAINKSKLGIGQYNLYINVTDKAGNKADLVQMRYTIKYEEPVCQIGSTKYLSIQEAVEACSKAAGDTQTTIEMLKSTDEEFSTYEGQNIILDLKGYKVGSSSIETPLCTNNGTLQLIDTSTNKTGKLESLNGTTIENNGTFTLGDNSTEIEYEVPTIYGKQVGIKNNNIFNFYDGKIQGITPIGGSTTDTPVEYGPVSTGYENGITTIQLGIVTGYEARIEWVYYTTVQDAVEATKRYGNDYRDTVTIIKDIQLKETLEIIETKDLKLDLFGHVLTVSAEKYMVIKNNGKLIITDNSKEKLGKIEIESKNLNYAIYNNGDCILKEGTISSGGNSTNYGIFNNGFKDITIQGGTVSSTAYGIYNYNTGNINIKGGTIKSTQCGIQNNSSGTINIFGGKIEAISDNGPNTMSAIINTINGNINIYDGEVTVDNSKNSYAIDNKKDGIVNVLGGIINSKGENSYGICNSEGEVVISGGIVNANRISNNSRYDLSYGIYNVSTGKIKLLEGIINSNCYGIYNSGNVIVGSEESNLLRDSIVISGINTETIGHGIYNAVDGEVYFYNGTIKGSANPLLGNITKVRDGYKIENDSNIEVKSIYLVEDKDLDYIVQIGTNKYTSIKEALNNIQENNSQTIKVIKNFELKEKIEFNKNLIFDLNGHTIDNYYYEISNESNIKIINSDDESAGIINFYTTTGFINQQNKILEIENVNITGEHYGIYNEGNLKLKKCDIQLLSEIYATCGIYSWNDSNNIILEDTNIKCTGKAFEMNATGISCNGNLQISGGKIETSSRQFDFGIGFNGRGDLIINEITLISQYCPINNYSSGNVVFKNGIIEGGSLRNS